MKLESLTVQGINCFDNPVSVDFRDLPLGLIAFVGKNGAGKTTLMESVLACLFQQFPSREKSLYHYATRTDSFIETTFELDDQRYRARLNLDGPHRKAEAVLLRDEGTDEWTRLSDGKVSTYETAIKELFPPLPDLLASIFAAQNRAGSFSTMKPKEKRDLFASLLGLDRYEEMAQRAKASAALLQQDIDRAKATRDALARDAGAADEEILDRRANSLQTDVGTMELRRVELQQRLQAAEVALSDCKNAAATHAAERTAVDRITVDRRARATEYANLQTVLERLVGDAEAERARLDERLRETVTRYEQEIADTSMVERERASIARGLSAAIAAADTKIENNRGLIAHAAEIRAAVAEIDRLDTAIAANLAERTTVQGEIDTLVARHVVLQRSLSDIQTAQAQLDRAQADADLLGHVPCGGVGQYAACEFLTNAHAAKARIAGLTEAVASLATVEGEIETVTAAHLAALARRTGLFRASIDLDTVREAKKPLAAKLQFLVQAEERIAALTKEKADATAAAAKATREADTRQEERIARLTREIADRREEHIGALVVLEERTELRRTEMEMRIEALAQTIVGLTVELTQHVERAAETADAAARAVEQQGAIAVFRQEWDASTESLSRLRSQVEQLQEQREALAIRRAEIGEVEQQIETLSTDLIEWSALARALGREGLQTLEIDAAGPTVSAFFNDLLANCYDGSPFTGELITQDAKVTKGKDGSTMKEVFELRLYDQRYGASPRDLQDLSGGERVIVEEAFRCAVALFVATRHNTTPMRTMFRDETTGALDPENALRYVGMLRRVQTIGEFERVIFVTHLPDVYQLADAQVRVGEGQATIALPPYVEEPAFA